MTQKHKMAISVPGSTVDSGTTSETLRLDSTTEMRAAYTDISGVSSTLEASLKCLRSALIALYVTFMTTGNTDVVSVMAEDSDMAPMIAGDSGMVSMMAEGSGVATMLPEDSGIVAMKTEDSGMVAITSQGSRVVAMMG